MRTQPVVLEPGSPSWPRRLLSIEDPPAELWVRGRPELLAAPVTVAIVGTRSPTPYGLEQARRFAAALAAQGVAVVSGMARGIDEAAHGGALESGGATIAVLGSGVDRPWPDGPLARELARSGALVSELEPGTPPRRHHFPRRNRLISGLSDAVVVIEAAAASGSLITARWAADQGKEVCALPGRVDHPMARGCHRLLREGAALVEDPDDVLAELGLARPRGDEPSAPPAGPERGPRARAILAALRGQTLTADEIAALTRIPTGEALALLVGLELEGAAARSPGGLWRLVPPRR